MDSYQKILEDLYQIFPIEVTPYAPPYEETATMDAKFGALKEALERSRRLGNRQMQLMYAFLLGQFLEKDVSTNALRTHYTQQLTQHYCVASQRTYGIFAALGADQIMRTVNTTLTLTRRLSQEEYQGLIIRSLEIFNGVEN